MTEPVTTPTPDRIPSRPSWAVRRHPTLDEKALSSPSDAAPKRPRPTEGFDVEAVTKEFGTEVAADLGRVLETSGGRALFLVEPGRISVMRRGADGTLRCSRNDGPAVYERGDGMLAQRFFIADHEVTDETLLAEVRDGDVKLGLLPGDSAQIIIYHPEDEFSPALAHGQDGWTVVTPLNATAKRHAINGDWPQRREAGEPAVTCIVVGDLSLAQRAATTLARAYGIKRHLKDVVQALSIQPDLDVEAAGNGIVFKLAGRISRSDGPAVMIAREDPYVAASGEERWMLHGTPMPDMVKRVLKSEPGFVAVAVTVDGILRKQQGWAVVSTRPFADGTYGVYLANPSENAPNWKALTPVSGADVPGLLAGGAVLTKSQIKGNTMAEGSSPARIEERIRAERGASLAR